MKNVKLKVSQDTRHQIFLQIIAILWEHDGASMLDLADRAGCHWTTLYNWRTGVVGAPRLDKIADVAQELGYELTLVKRRAALRRVK